MINKIVNCLNAGHLIPAYAFLQLICCQAVSCLMMFCTDSKKVQLLSRNLFFVLSQQLVSIGKENYFHLWLTNLHHNFKRSSKSKKLVLEVCPIAVHTWATNGALTDVYLGTWTNVFAEDKSMHLRASCPVPKWKVSPQEWKQFICLTLYM